MRVPASPRCCSKPCKPYVLLRHPGSQQHQQTVQNLGFATTPRCATNLSVAAQPAKPATPRCDSNTGVLQQHLGFALNVQRLQNLQNQQHMGAAANLWFAAKQATRRVCSNTCVLLQHLQRHGCTHMPTSVAQMMRARDDARAPQTQLGGQSRRGRCKLVHRTRPRADLNRDRWIQSPECQPLRHEAA